MRDGIPDWMIRISIFLNEQTGGRKGWSLCARAYDNKLEGKPYAKETVALYDALFFWDTQHCRKAWLLRMR